MSNIANLFCGMVTRDSDNSGTDSSIVLIVNINGNDFLQFTFPDSSQKDQETGQANFYGIQLLNRSIDTKDLPNAYYRVGIRGSDVWRPEHFFLWGADDQDNSPVPLAIAIDLKKGNISDRNYYGEVVPNEDPFGDLQLSTDPDKGDLSFPLTPVHLGAPDTIIRRLLLIMFTGDGDDDGTNSGVYLSISVRGERILHYFLTDTPQDDLKKSSANFYFIPLPVPFQKDKLDPKSITLTIIGDDAWKPGMFSLFGLDTAERIPQNIVPLIHQLPFTLGTLSTDMDEGKSSVFLPIV